MKKVGVTVCVLVDVPPDEAFAVFTGEIGSWWKPFMKNRFRPSRQGRMRFEPGEGGRLVEEDPDAPGDVFEVGRIRAWEPGRRLLFDWKLPNFADGEITEVEVQFQAKGAGTLVTLEHRGSTELRKDHPARHGLTDDAAYARMLGQWWDGIAADMQAYVWSKQPRGETRMEKHIRPGHTPVTPYIVAGDAKKLLEFLEKAFGAEVLNQTHNLDGSIGHAEVRLNGQVLMCGQAKEQFKAMPATFSVYVPDCDAVFKQAVAAGGKVIYEPSTHDYGDRSGGVEDPVGNYWWVTTHVNA
jgi:uncharacterized glyoxalase superfamily protein PhnB/uncharacterized protein YndB with AHSA1/START domain